MHAPSAAEAAAAATPKRTADADDSARKRAGAGTPPLLVLPYDQMRHTAVPALATLPVLRADMWRSLVHCVRGPTHDFLCFDHKRGIVAVSLADPTRVCWYRAEFPDGHWRIAALPDGGLAIMKPACTLHIAGLGSWAGDILIFPPPRNDCAAVISLRDAGERALYDARMAGVGGLQADERTVPRVAIQDGVDVDSAFSVSPDGSVFWVVETQRKPAPEPRTAWRGPGVIELGASRAHAAVPPKAPRATTLRGYRADGTLAHTFQPGPFAGLARKSRKVVALHATAADVYVLMESGYVCVCNIADPDASRGFALCGPSGIFGDGPLSSGETGIFADGRGHFVVWELNWLKPVRVFCCATGKWVRDIMLPPPLDDWIGDGISEFASLHYDARTGALVVLGDRGAVEFY